VLRDRYGHELPDDDAGREDLYELLLLHSLHPTHPVERMEREIELLAPWLSEQEGQEMMSNVIKLDKGRRWALTRTQGERLRLRNEERERAKAFSMPPVDRTPEELAELARERRTWRRKAKRRHKGVTPRALYERNALAKTEPWKAMGISKRTWYRRGLHRGTSVVLPKVFSERTRPVPPGAWPRGEAQELPERGGGWVVDNIVPFPQFFVRDRRRRA
jgi:hypothetical protein